MYEFSLVLLGFCTGLLVKFTLAVEKRRESNVQTRVSTGPKTVTLPLSRGKVDWNALPKPSTANMPKRVQ